VASAILFILSLLALLDAAGRQRRSKVEPLTPAQVVSLRGAKTSGYATISFDITVSKGRQICVEEIWLGKYYKETKIGDIINIFPDDNVCGVPVFPKIPMLLEVFVFCAFSFVIMIAQAGKYIEAIRVSRIRTHALSRPAGEVGNA
jgi:hypothetical protein